MPFVGVTRSRVVNNRHGLFIASPPRQPSPGHVFISPPRFTLLFHQLFAVFYLLRMFCMLVCSCFPSAPLLAAIKDVLESEAEKF